MKPFHVLKIMFLPLLALSTAARADDNGGFQVVEASIADIQDAFRSGDLTPEQLVQMYLDRIAAYDQPGAKAQIPQTLNSFMHVNERALDEARALNVGDLDGEDSDDEDGGRKPLLGVAVILKDNVATKDMPTTAGSVALGKSIPNADAFITTKLRRAGAIVIGKGSLTEFANFIALGMPTGYNSQLRFQLFQSGGDLARVGYGFNPFDPRTDPRPAFNDGRPALATGGSSSGPGIAVNASLATVGVGTETSGSILSPSSQNMLVGIKPTVGLVSRTGIVPITADQDTAGPMARSVTDAAKLLGVLAGFDPADPATAECLKPGKCLRDYTRFLDENALNGARIAVPKRGYWTFTRGDPPRQLQLSEKQQEVMNNAIAVLRDLGATVDEAAPAEDPKPVDIPDQLDLFNFPTCVQLSDLAAKKDPNKPVPCTSVLLFGFKHDLNDYLATFGPGVADDGSIVRSLADVIHFNDNFTINGVKVALKYKQDIAIAAESLDTSPGSADTARYKDDRAKDLELSRTRGLDAIYENYDAVLFPANFGANVAARAGYPSIVVPGGFVDNPAVPPPPLAPPPPFPDGFDAKPSPFGVTFSGPAFSEGKLIGFAFAFEQATRHRVSPPTTPPLSAGHTDD